MGNLIGEKMQRKRGIYFSFREWLFFNGATAVASSSSRFGGTVAELQPCFAFIGCKAGSGFQHATRLKAFEVWPRLTISNGIN